MTTELFSRGYDDEIFEIPYGTIDVETFHNLLIWSSKKKVSDISLMSDDYVWCDFSGHKVKVTRKKIPKGAIDRIIQAVYGEHGPSELLSGNALDPSYEVREYEAVEGKVDKKFVVGRYRFRVNITAGQTRDGTGFELSIRPIFDEPLTVEQLGVNPVIVENLCPRQGLNIFAGPTGSGKSTLMSSLLRYIGESDDYSVKMVEYSSPIEFVYTGSGVHFKDSFIRQSEVGRHLISREDSVSDFSLSVANALRRKPDIIIIGEARDKETIEGCISASKTGHITFTTMHTIGVPETISRAIENFPSHQKNAMAIDLLSTLNLVVCQLLLPRKGGGRVAIQEFMVFDQRARTGLSGLPYEDWSAKLREMINNHQVIGQSFAHHARVLLKQDLITPETYEESAKRTSSESRLIRDAIAHGYL